MQELTDKPWLIWLAIAVVFGIAEVAVPYFACAFVAVAALVSALVALFSRSWEIQIGVFALSLILGLLLLRPKIIQVFQSKKGVPSRTDELIGKTGIVTEAIDPALGTGRIEVNSQDWAARSDVPLPVKTSVKVESADGIVLNVRKG